MSTSETIIESFKKNPLCLLFFAVGTVLVLLGLSTSLEIPILKRIVAEPTWRSVAAALGVAAWVAAAVIYYRPPKGGEVPAFEELGWTLYSRVTTLDYSQGALLRFLDRSGAQGERVPQDAIEREFRGTFQRPELYFRLEHLRALKLIAREDAGKADNTKRYSYRLTDEYLAARRKQPELFNEFFDQQERLYESARQVTNRGGWGSSANAVSYPKP